MVGVKKGRVRFWIVAGVVILGVLGVLWQTFLAPKGLTAKVYSGDTLLADYPLKGRQKIYSFQGRISTVEIAVGSEGAYFKSSGCPDHICIKSGNLTQLGENAACLPNEILLVIR